MRRPPAAPPGGGTAWRRLTAGPKPAAARHPRKDRTPAGSRGSRPPAGLNFKLKHFKKLIGRKLKPGIRKHIGTWNYAIFCFGLFFYPRI